MLRSAAELGGIRTNGKAIDTAIQTFLRSLSAPMRERIQFPFDHEERRDWSNLPHAIHPRRGVSMGELTASSRMEAHRLLSTALSSHGYLKATGIMAIEAIDAIVPRRSNAAWHVLAQEREKGFAVIESLTSSQRARAALAEKVLRHLRRPAAGQGAQGVRGHLRSRLR
jgi:hypothetical protein